MAKAGGATRLGRDSQPKYLGIKIADGQKVKVGMIIVKQRGTKFLPGKNVKKGSDDTLYAIKEGVVSFSKKSKKRFDGSTKIKKIVNVEPLKEKGKYPNKKTFFLSAIRHFFVFSEAEELFSRIQKITDGVLGVWT